jgi:hypothetical protein
MTDQPEALRLTDLLVEYLGADHPAVRAISAELRRLYQSEREGWRYADELEQERKRLHEENAAMLKALRVAVLALAHANEAAPGLYDDAYNKVSDAIDQAEGR